MELTQAQGSIEFGLLEYDSIVQLVVKLSAMLIFESV